MKKFAAIILIITVCMLFTGCAEVNVLSYYDEYGNLYNDIEIVIEDAIVTAMENTAAQKNAGGAWTVAEYFRTLMEHEGYVVKVSKYLNGFTGYYSKYYDTDFEFTDLEKLRSGFSNPSFDPDSPYYYQETVDTEMVSNMFLHKIYAKQPNPFNGLRQKYDAVAPNANSTLMDRLKNGYYTYGAGNKKEYVYPSIADAFPFLAGKNADELILNLFWYTDARFINNSGTPLNDGAGGTVYKYSRAFDDFEDYIEYAYIRPNTWGWYLAAIVAGAIAAGIVYLITNSKKQKPVLLDRFPYNPEEYPDLSGVNLPSQRKD